MGAPAIGTGPAPAATLRAWRPRWRPGVLAFPLALAVGLLMLAINELGYRQAEADLSRLVKMGQVRLELSRAVRRVADAESGQRGYLLVGRPEYLAPYRDASADVTASLRTLQALYQSLGDVAGEDGLRKLRAEMENKLSELDAVVQMADGGRRPNALALVATGIGRDQMDSIRRQADALIDAENRQVAAGLASVFGTLAQNRIGISAMTAISLLVLGMYLRQRRLADQQRSAQQLAIQHERDRLEAEVRHRTTELTELARHLETAHEDERARLARDLHDELGALLTAAKLDVARMRPKLTQNAPDLLPRVAHLVETLNSGIALKRRIIEDLRPSTLSNLGLQPALDILCSEAAERLAVPVHTNFAPVALSPSAELTVFRLVQEALNNIAKHAHASEVTITLGVQPDGQAMVSVRDNGRGFVPAQTRHASHGLVGMRYRVQAEAGQLTVHAAPGLGTLVQAVLPQQTKDASNSEAPTPLPPAAS
jgi:signal transduction histidine kinase